MIDPASPGALGALPPPGESGLPAGESGVPPRQPHLVPVSGPGSDAGAAGRTGFAHASEAEMSRILDFYGVAWRYEPTTFPILWNLDGDVVESFSPDFYLPEFDLYLEMTTLKQSLVRKKNRKLRRLRELYPDIRIKLFYARDFRAMMLKYGRLGLAESLSGASGQLGGTPAIDDEPRSVDYAPRQIAALATTPPARRRTMRRSDRGEAPRGAGTAVAKGEGERA